MSVTQALGRRGRVDIPADWPLGAHQTPLHADADLSVFGLADKHGERLAELLPQGRFALIEGSRCFVPEERPEELVALLRDFVAR
jgi:hypothetical protein